MNGININIQKITTHLESKLTTNINNAVDFVKEELDQNTPEDTKTLLGNNNIEKAKKVGNSIVGRVFNNTPYAKYVEYGVSGQDYNYHKPKGSVMYSGKGNRTFYRTRVDNEKQVIQIISNIGNLNSK